MICIHVVVCVHVYISGCHPGYGSSFLLLASTLNLQGNLKIKCMKCFYRYEIIPISNCIISVLKYFIFNVIRIIQTISKRNFHSSIICLLACKYQTALQSFKYCNAWLVLKNVSGLCILPISIKKGTRKTGYFQNCIW